MLIDDDLKSVLLIDCTGWVTHKLTLQIDGTVAIRSRTTDGVVVVDPTRRCCLTPGVQVPDQLMDVASNLRP